jgi:ribosomal protein S18 acetylase RimI-like enzyme
MQISDFAVAQAHELVVMWRASFEHGVGVIDPHPIEDQLRFFLKEIVPSNKVRVVLEGSSVIAFMASKPEAVSHLYVHVRSIGRGIGSQLLGLAKAESYGRLWLHTFAQNQNARHFYECHGFTEVERESENMWKLESIKYQWRRNTGAA